MPCIFAQDLLSKWQFIVTKNIFNCISIDTRNWGILYRTSVLCVRPEISIYNHTNNKAGIVAEYLNTKF